MSLVAVSGTMNAYRILLGDAVVDGLVSKLSKEALKDFFKLHAQYDIIAEKHPKSDPVTMLDTESLPRFDSVLDYERFLNRILNKLTPMRDEPAPQMVKFVKGMLKILEDSQQKTTTATASVKVAHKALRGGSLPSVPLSMQMEEALPYSYPSFAKTYDVVTNFWYEKNYTSRLCKELDIVVRASVSKLHDHLKHTGTTAALEELAVSAQVYLMEHNWIRYGLDNVATASLNLASAGVSHEVTTEGDIFLTGDCIVSYNFLGANLESVLRRCVNSLVKDVMGGVVLAGRQPAVDVVIACCSKKIQEEARNWLECMHLGFNQNTDSGLSSNKMCGDIAAVPMAYTNG